MPNKKTSPRELYEAVVRDAGRSTVAEIAKQFGLKAPLLTHYIMQFCAEEGLQLPRMTFRKKQTVLKVIKRSTSENDIRVSTLRLQEAGLGETLSFKLLGDENLKMMVIVDSEAMKNINSLEDVASLIMQKGDGDGDGESTESGAQPATKVRALHLPIPGSSKSKKTTK